MSPRTPSGSMERPPPWSPLGVGAGRRVVEMPGPCGPSKPEEEDRAGDWRPLRTPHHPPRGLPHRGRTPVWAHSALPPPGDYGCSEPPPPHRKTRKKAHPSPLPPDSGCALAGGGACVGGPMEPDRATHQPQGPVFRQPTASLHQPSQDRSGCLGRSSPNQIISASAPGPVPSRLRPLQMD